MRHCPNYSTLLSAKTDTQMLVARSRCGMWSCPYCAAINASQWRRRIYLGSAVLGIDSWSFFTLTAHSKIVSPELQWRSLSAGWSKIRKRLKRKFGPFHYIRVFERGCRKKRRVHMHVIASFNFDADDMRTRTSRDGEVTPYSIWLASVARGVKIGYITHAENMRTVAGASKYITKYITKIEGAELPKGCRRIQASQGFPRVPRDTEHQWDNIGVLTWREYSEMLDVEVYDVQLDRCLEMTDFDGGYYPPDSPDKLRDFFKGLDH